MNSTDVPADAHMADEDDEESSDSDFEEIEATEEDVATINRIEEELEANPNLYDKHVEYIAVLRKCKMKARLKSARLAMHTRFPLAEPLWLEWLEDEIPVGHSAEQITEVQGLFELAVQDYLSITIWLKYLGFLAIHDVEVRTGSAAGKDKMRTICERALTAGGLHLSEGSKLWQAYRDYEAQHAGPVDANDHSHPVIKLLHRQLQVPLQDGAQTLADLHRLAGTAASGAGDASLAALPETVKQGHAKAQAMLRARMASEESVSASKPADTSLLAAFMAYIKLEETSGEPSRVKIMYERALAKFPVTHVLWLQYTFYLEQHLNIPAVVNQVFARAVRNCPWVGALWSRSLRALERINAPDDEHEAVYNAALAAGMESAEDYMEVSLARLDALRRQGPSRMDDLREAFRGTDELLQTYFPDYIDRSLRIPAYWATCELEMAEDHDAACDVWEAALKTPLNMYAEAIAGYVALEVSAKKFKEARSIFRKYHRRPVKENGGLAICEAWLRFEREHGSAEDYHQAMVKVEPVLTQAAAAMVEAAEPQAAAHTKAAAKNVPQPPSKADVKRMRQEKDPNFKLKQPERAPRETAKRKKGLGFQETNTSKRAKTEPEAKPAASSESRQFASAGIQDVNTVDAPDSSSSAATVDAAEPRTGGASDQRMGPPPPRSMASPETRASKEAAEAIAEQQSESSQQQPKVQQHQRKVFVKSIASTASRSDLEALLAPCGKIVDLSMPVDRKSQPPRHRGFAYVTFDSSEGLSKALALNGMDLQGQPVSIVTSHEEVPDDQRTAFILNVPPSTESATLEALLAPCGAIKALRLPLDRETSQPRGFAYVEFETSEGLQRAVDMTGVELDGSNLKISIALPPGGAGGRGRGRGPGRGGAAHGRGPPARGRAGRGPPRRGGLENGGSGAPAAGGRAGRQHLDLQRGGGNMFRPRSVGRGGGSEPKSNSDFRAMLQ